MFKRSIFSAFFLMVFYNLSFAQVIPTNADSIKKPGLKRKTYFQLSIGYHIPSGIGVFREEQQVNNMTVYEKNQGGSYGGGAEIAIGFGRYLSKNVALEMNMSALFGASNIVNNKYTFNLSNPSYYVNQTIEAYTNTFRINPCLVLSTDQEKKISLYSKTGFLFGFNSDITQTEKADVFFSNGVKGSGAVEWNGTGSNPLGYHLSLGTRIKLDDGIDFFTELMLVNMSRWVESYTMVSSSINNKSNLDDIDVADKNYIYSDEVHKSGSQDPDQPTELPSYKISYNSWGFKIGIMAYLK